MADPPEKDPQNTIVAFLDLVAFEDGAAFRGGCLVTDATTRPVEFRVTGPIRPTKLQRMLYGDSLHGYISNDLVGLPIIKTLETRPALLLVRDAEFLNLRPLIDIPLLLIDSPAKGKPTFQAHPQYTTEADMAGEMLPDAMRDRNLMEPFARVHHGLEEAHNLKVGES
jgi:hypothetical protein